MIPLHFSDEQSPELSELLARIAQRIEDQPELMERTRTCYELVIELMEGCAYRPGLEPAAQFVGIAFREDGWIYSLDETQVGRGGGGWIGSSIPAGRIEAFARDWLDQTDPHRVEQIDLF